MSTEDSTGVSIRAVLTGAVLVFAISLISPWAVLMVKGSQLTSNAIPIIAVALLFLTTLVATPLLRALGARWAFNRSELITIYIMMLVGSVVVTTGFTGSFLSIITGAMYYATPENEWAELFIPYIHPWLAPTNTEAVRLFYEGLPQGMPIPWSAWSLPLLAWMAFIFVFYLVTLCMGVLLRGQWVENERLVYPLTRLPLAMIEDPEGNNRLNNFFHNRLLWIGFLIPLLLHSWNSLNFYHDAFQPIVLNGQITLIQGLLALPYRFNLPIMGMAYLMPLNVAFSIWFFFILGMIERLIFARIGLVIGGGGDIWTSGGGHLAISHQMAGGFLALSLFVLWTARPHFSRLWQLAKTGQKAEREVISPRAAFSGLIFGLIFMVAWLSLTGLSFYVAVLVVLGAIIVFVGLSRIVCEAGIPGAQMPMAPQAFITRGFGPETLGLGNMTGLGYSTVWLGETAANMMNAIMHSLKLTSTETRSSSRLSLAIFLAIAVGLAGSIWITMQMAYTYGGINLNGWYYDGAPRWPFRYMTSVYNLPNADVGTRFAFAGGGAGVMAALLFLRQRFLWWPLHPIGFPIANTYTIVSYGWLAIFMAWLFKAIILRYGGVRLYRTMIPFFLGLTLGEFFTAVLWVFIDGFFGIQGNRIFNF
jgi:hypothetical protein